MSYRTQAVWKGMMLRAVAGLVLVASPAAAQPAEAIDEPVVRMDNRGSGSLNSGRDRNGDGGRRGNDDLRVPQAGDVRQEDRQQDRREDRQADRQQDRREDRQADRREDRREDRRSNVGGELRGLDRADLVAGEHGREGRDSARVAQMDRLNRIERAERPQRPERPERLQRPERPERPERPGHN